MGSTAPLRVVVAHRPPFVFVSNDTGSASFSGLLIDLLDAALAYSNTTLRYEAYVSPTNSGGSLSNGAWTGVVGELFYGRADVALFPLTRTSARLTGIDCTYSYMDQGLALLVRDSSVGPGPLSVLAPFETTLWATLLCTVLGVGIIFWALDAYGRWIRARQTDALQAAGALSAKAAARAKRDDKSPVLISFMAVAGAPERPERAHWGVQVLYVFYCFFCLIVLSAYTANLTSFLAVQRAAGGIGGLQDLIRGNLLLGVNPGGSTASYFASSFDTLAMQLQPNVRYCDTETCIAWLRQGAVSAFVSDQSLLTYRANQRPCDLAVVGEAFGPGNLVVGLQKGSPLLPVLNAAIQSFVEDGSLSALRRRWFDGLSQCADSGADEDSRMGVGEMLGAFVFLAVGVLIAFVTGTVENLRWCAARALNRSQGLVRSFTSGPLSQNFRAVGASLGSVARMRRPSPSAAHALEGHQQEHHNGSHQDQHHAATACASGGFPAAAECGAGAVGLATPPAHGPAPPLGEITADGGAAVDAGWWCNPTAAAGDERIAAVVLPRLDARQPGSPAATPLARGASGASEQLSLASPRAGFTSDGTPSRRFTDVHGAGTLLLPPPPAPHEPPQQRQLRPQAPETPLPQPQPPLHQQSQQPQQDLLPHALYRSSSSGGGSSGSGRSSRSSGDGAPRQRGAAAASAATGGPTSAPSSVGARSVASLRQVVMLVRGSSYHPTPATTSTSSPTAAAAASAAAVAAAGTPAAQASAQQQVQPSSSPRTTGGLPRVADDASSASDRGIRRREPGAAAGWRAM